MLADGGRSRRMAIKRDRQAEQPALCGRNPQSRGPPAGPTKGKEKHDEFMATSVQPRTRRFNVRSSSPAPMRDSDDLLTPGGESSPRDTPSRAYRVSGVSGHIDPVRLL